MLTAMDEAGGSCTSITSWGHATRPGIRGHLHLARLLRWQLRRYLHKGQERLGVVRGGEFRLHAALLLQEFVATAPPVTAPTLTTTTIALPAAAVAATATAVAIAAAATRRRRHRHPRPYCRRPLASTV